MTESPTTPTEEKKAKRARLVEDAFILLCILCLWPVILDWTEPIYQYVLYVALAGLVVIFVRRTRRFRDSRSEFDNGNGQSREQKPG